MTAYSTRQINVERTISELGDDVRKRWLTTKKKFIDIEYCLPLWLEPEWPSDRAATGSRLPSLSIVFESLHFAAARKLPYMVWSMLQQSHV